MSTSELTCFKQLKEDIAATAGQACPGNSADIRTWKGKEIKCFQEDLIKRVNGRISEKWFYTHIKADRDQVPRVDILNLLCRYVGYESWNAYRQQHQVNEAPQTSSQRWFWLAGALLILAGVFGFYLHFQRVSTYQFCFINAYNKQPVDASDIDVTIMLPGESPYRLSVSYSGCLTVNTQDNQVKLIVRSSYYKNDTIVRSLNKAEPNERVALETDDYAWMIRLFSHSEVDNWQQRREQLDSMIAPNARIYQLYDDQALGLALYNKQEFINKLTMPLRSLRHLDVLDIRYRGNQIEVLRFKQNSHDIEP